jgi:plastocyanin
MRRFRSLFVVPAIVVLATAACSSPRDTGFPPVPTASSASPSPSASTGGGALTGPIEIVDSAFSPAEADVAVGAKVEWKQTGSAPHSVTAVPGQALKFDSSPACAGGDLSKCLGSGDTFSFTFAKAGTYKYYCRIHGSPDGSAGMVGTVVVK